MRLPLISKRCFEPVTPCAAPWKFIFMRLFGKILSKIISQKRRNRKQKTEGRRQKTEDRRQKTEGRRQKTEDRRQKTEDRRQKTEGRRQKTEDRRQKTEDRRQKTEDRRQKTEDRRQKTEDRRQKTEDRRQKTDTLLLLLAVFYFLLSPFCFLIKICYIASNNFSSSIMKRIAINGFGRIGRMAAQVLLEKYKSEVELVAVNDLTDTKTLAHLFQFDSTYGVYPGEVSFDEKNIIVKGKKILALAE